MMQVATPLGDKLAGGIEGEAGKVFLPFSTWVGWDAPFLSLSPR